MKEENVILDKSFAFALRILKLYLFLRKKKVDTGYVHKFWIAELLLVQMLRKLLEVHQEKIL